jgi:FkbM family methyltransferase
MPTRTPLQSECSKNRCYFSQNGEDVILWELFKEDDFAGHFLDVGALDGRRFSNTLSFEQYGWSGMCVEAHPDYIELLKMNRPLSEVVHAAVTNKNQEAITFYANSRGSLSTLDKSLESHFARYGKFFTGFEEIQVPAMTIDTIIGNKYANIDLVSIDIEGGEPEALEGFSLHRYFPRVLVLEELNQARGVRICQHMEKNGYLFARKLVNNLFFCRDREDVDIIREAKTDKELIHTPHPLDKE